MSLIDRLKGSDEENEKHDNTSIMKDHQEADNDFDTDSI